MEESINKINELRAFSSKYREFMKALLSISKVAAENEIIITEITIPGRWVIRHPDLLNDMEKNGLDKKILGFKISKS